MRYIIPAIMLAGVVVISGCGTPKESCPVCPGPSSWTQCGEQGEKTRTNHQCGEQTNYECQSFEEKEMCKTEIIAKGMTSSEFVIKPTLENEIKGIVSIELKNAPENTLGVGFAIQGKGIEDFKNTGPNLTVDRNGNDGWTYLLDTEKYKNGLYSIHAFAMNTGDGPPLDAVSAQVIINN